MRSDSRVSSSMSKGSGTTTKISSMQFFVLLIVLINQWFVVVTVWSYQRLTSVPNDNVPASTTASSTGRRYPHLMDETNIEIPKNNQDGTPMSNEERLRYLEMKVNAYMNFGADPFFGVTERSKCAKSSELAEFGCHPGWEDYIENDPECNGSFDHVICLDNLPPPTTTVKKGQELPQAPLSDCLVYDFGIRKQPQFGAVMARIFGCEVHAFDPSPVSVDWWNSPQADKLRQLPNYHFHPYGAGGQDGTITLREYDWGQVSIMRYPTDVVDCSNATSTDVECPVLEGAKVQDTFELPVKTLGTIRKELGHEGRRLDVLKLDVEGSEYAFLENMLDAHAGCPAFVNQVALEWHHMPWDARYGEGSNPSINAIATLLHACGLQLFWNYGSWPSGLRYFDQMKLHNVRYDLATFHREKHASRNTQRNGLELLEG